MTGYALVKDGQVLEVTSWLPQIHENVSGFNNFGSAEAKAYGFLPYTYIQPDYDAFTQQLGDTTYEITADAVVGTRQIVALDQTLAVAQKTSVTNDVLNALNQVLYNTDWTQMSASGLTAGQASAYAGLRTSIATAKPQITNIAVQNADTVRSKIGKVLSDSRARMAVMPNSLALLKTALDNIGA